jgi:hypothetical protein
MKYSLDLFRQLLIRIMAMIPMMKWRLELTINRLQQQQLVKNDQNIERYFNQYLIIISREKILNK